MFVWFELALPRRPSVAGGVGTDTGRTTRRRVAAALADEPAFTIVGRRDRGAAEGGARPGGMADPGAGVPVGGRPPLMLVPRTEHVYARPAWDCRVCEQPWPCATAKVELAEQYDRFPTNLTIYLASCMYDAIEDMTAHGSRSPADLFDRFLGWARASRVSGSSAGSQS